MRNVHLPARVRRSPLRDGLHDRPGDRLRACTWQPAVGAAPEYVKPHWPYMAPAPFTRCPRADSACRSCAARASRTTPIRSSRLSPAGGVPELPRDEADPHRAAGVPGPDFATRLSSGAPVRRARLVGRMSDTLVIFCADHGDFLGDHGWARRSCSTTRVRVPLIVVDPRARRRDARHVEQRFVECVDIVPTVLDALGVAALASPRRALASAVPAGRARRAMARRGVFRARLRVPACTPGAGARSARVPRVHDPRARLEIHPLGRFSPAAFRAGRRSGGAPRPSPRPPVRSRAHTAARALVRLARRRQAPDDGRRRDGRGAHRRASRAHGIHIGVW